MVVQEKRFRAYSRFRLLVSSARLLTNSECLPGLKLLGVRIKWLRISICGQLRYDSDKKLEARFSGASPE